MTPKFCPKTRLQNLIQSAHQNFFPSYDPTRTLKCYPISNTKNLPHLWHPKLNPSMTLKSYPKHHSTSTGKNLILQLTPKSYPPMTPKSDPAFCNKILSHLWHQTLIQPLTPKSFHLTSDFYPTSYTKISSGFHGHISYAIWHQGHIPPLTSEFYPIAISESCLVPLGPAYNGTCPVQMGHVNSTPLWLLKNHQV